MGSVGIRELKNNLSQCVRRVEKGETIVVTVHGRVVAELGPPRKLKRAGRISRFDQLVAAGVVRPPLEEGNSTKGWRKLHLPSGTAAALMEEVRGKP